MMAKPFLKVFPTNCVYFMPVIVPGRITTVESIYIGVHGHPNIIGTNYLKDHRLRADAREAIPSLTRKLNAKLMREIGQEVGRLLFGCTRSVDSRVFSHFNPKALSEVSGYQSGARDCKRTCLATLQLRWWGNSEPKWLSWNNPWWFFLMSEKRFMYRWWALTNKQLKHQNEP